MSRVCLGRESNINEHVGFLGSDGMYGNKHNGNNLFEVKVVIEGNFGLKVD